jgi:hypothetical protein
MMALVSRFPWENTQKLIQRGKVFVLFEPIGAACTGSHAAAGQAKPALF